MAKYKLLIILLALTNVFVWGYALLHGKTFPVLNPVGTVAQKERNLFLLAISLMLVVVIPVFFMTFFFAWKYRVSNKSAQYTPDWDKNSKLQLLWWMIPAIIIAILAVINWQSSHELDPFRPLASNKPPLVVEVVALQWRWLFIYPKQHIATINYLEFPQKTPITFELTADAPMNSFWIPELGGQMYAMAGMVNRTHLIANTTGVFRGSDAEISGSGFGNMVFSARSVTQSDFDTWAKGIANSSSSLDWSIYSALAQPSSIEGPQYYSLGDLNLYNEIVNKYMAPSPKENSQSPNQTHEGGSPSMPGMQM